MWFFGVFHWLVVPFWSTGIGGSAHGCHIVVTGRDLRGVDVGVTLGVSKVSVRERKSHLRLNLTWLGRPMMMLKKEGSPEFCGQSFL